MFNLKVGHDTYDVYLGYGKLFIDEPIGHWHSVTVITEHAFGHSASLVSSVSVEGLVSYEEFPKILLMRSIVTPNIIIARGRDGLLLHNVYMSNYTNEFHPYEKDIVRITAVFIPKETKEISDIRDFRSEEGIIEILRKEGYSPIEILSILTKVESNGLEANR